ncbi:MAG: alpha/beta hydrolase [Saprospiraceae bacterium]|nr:alpha/beta hydrolase [Saprospiraceae bacterium]
MLKSILFWGSLIISVLFILALLIINIMASVFNSTDYAIDEYFSKLNTPFQIHRTPYQGDELRFVETGIQNDTVPLLLFIHGAPGTWDAFKQYLADYDLNQNIRLVSMDRLGYGGSHFGQSERSIEKHALAALHILDKYENREVYVVSHSYGGPISAVMASLAPEKISGLIMCAPVNDPDSEPLAWYAKVANWKIARAVLPAFVDVATDEKMSHRQALRNIKDHWKNVQCPVLHYHGTEDSLAPFDGNVKFSKQNIHPDLVRFITDSGGGHLLIWFKAATFKQIILDFISQNKN